MISDHPLSAGKTLLIFLTFLVSCQPEKKNIDSVNAGTLANRNFFFSLPYENTQSDAPVITVMINGKKRRFMIDTGAPLMISKSLQDECHFPLFQDTHLKDSNGDTTGVKIVVVNDLSIAELNFKGIPALVLDFSKPPFDCDPIDGFIGSNLLRLLIIQFNKPQQRIYLGDHIDSFRLPARTTKLDMYLNHSQSDPGIAVNINGITDSTLFDTGDKVLYTIAKTKFDNLNAQQNWEKNIALKGTGVGSQGVVTKTKDSLSSFVLKIDSLTFGPSRITHVLAEPTYSEPSRIGRGILNYGLVTMDYLKKNFYFTPVAASQEFKQLPNIGIRCQERNDRLVVSVVWKNTEAAANGIHPGDEIVFFGGFSPANTSKCLWPELVKKESAAASVPVMIKNSKGETKKITLHPVSL